MDKAPRRKQTTKKLSLTAEVGLPPPPERQASLFESNALWGSFSLVAALVLAVVAGMVKDLRWLLWGAWLVSWVTVWVVTKRISQPQCESAYFVLGIMITALPFYLVNIMLEPKIRDSESQIEAALPKGSLRFNKIDIPQEYSSIGIGTQFGVNWHFINPGPGRVFNTLGFYHLYVEEEVTEHTDRKVMELFESDLRHYLARKPGGFEVGSGEGMWMTMRTPSFTQQQFEGILKGTTRIYFVAWLMWTDAQGDKDPPLYRCAWLQGESLQPANLTEDLIWHFCIT